MKKAKQFIVRGRVLTKEDKKGVLGLRIVMFDKDLIFDDKLGSTVSNEDGDFVLQYHKKDFRDFFEKAPDLYVKVSDCKGDLVYSSEDKVVWEAGKTVELTVSIPRSKLDQHLQNMRPISRLSGSVVGQDKIGVIDQAIKLLVNRGMINKAVPLGKGWSYFHRSGAPIPIGAEYCAAPDIFFFEDILDLSWGVIENDPCALPQFIDIVDTIIHRKEVRKSEQIRTVQKRWSRQSSSDAEAVRRRLQAKRELLGPSPSETLIEKDRILPVIMATILAARGDQAVQNRYLSIMLGEMRALGQMDVVYRSALNALHSNPSGIVGFEEILRHVGGTCSPNDAPELWPIDRDDIPYFDEIAIIEKWLCTMEMEIAIERGFLTGGSYIIDEISWEDGCPGSPIVITGQNFSSMFPSSYRVQFTHRSGSNTSDANAEAAAAEPVNIETDWTDTRIEVLLPEEAGPGLVSLRILDGFESVCGNGLPVYRVGRNPWFNLAAFFDGGAAYIRVFTANDRRLDEIRVDPGETIMLRWFVVPNGTNVRLHIVQDNVVVMNHQLVDTEGDFIVNIPAGQASLTVCTLTVDSTCGSDTRAITLYGALVPALEIVGIEVTQSIQYYRAEDHLDDAADHQPDNSVPLVVGKPALVRAYARSGLPFSYEGGSISGVTGSLEVTRIESGAEIALTTINSLPIIAEADYPVYDDERRNLNTTANFIIPANHMSGRLRLTATIQTGVGLLHTETTNEITIDVTLEQTLRVAGIMVSYNGLPDINDPPGTPNLVLPAPTLADLRTTATRAIAAFPVRSDSATTFRVAGTIQQTVPLQDPMHPPGHGGCSVNWDALMADLRAEVALDSPTATGNWVYYGLLANGMPIGAPAVSVPGVRYVGGCGGGGVGTGEVGSGWIMAHEVGHALSLSHAPCGNPNNPDPNYPAYEPYDPLNTPTASTGEYGFDFSTGMMAIQSPLTIPTTDGTKDFMSYCGPEWISPYHYDKLLNIGLLTPSTIPSGMGEGAYEKQQKHMEPQPLINIIGFAGEDGIQVHSVSRLVTRPNFIGGTLTDLTMELLNEKDEVISSAPAYRFQLEGPVEIKCDNKSTCRAMIQAFVPNVARGAMLRIRNGKDVLWERESPPIPVKLNKVHTSLVRDKWLKIEWNAEIAEGSDSRTSIRWSNDQGMTWHGLTSGLKGFSAELDLAQVPGGEVEFEVLVNDGFDTASRVSEPVQIPHKPPTVAIHSPMEGASVSIGTALRLWGAATDEVGKRLPEESCTWLLDSKAIASGTDVIIEAPESGKHKITFQAIDAHGTAKMTHSFTVSNASQQKRGQIYP